MTKPKRKFKSFNVKMGTAPSIVLINLLCFVFTKNEAYTCFEICSNQLLVK